MQPYRPAGRRELGCILQQVGDDAFHLGRIESKFVDFLIGQEIHGQPAFLKARRPQAADFRKAGVDVAGLEPHFELAGFEHAEAQKVLDVTLQPLAVGVHVAQHFALALVQSPSFSLCSSST